MIWCVCWFKETVRGEMGEFWLRVVPRPPSVGLRIEIEHLRSLGGGRGGMKSWRVSGFRQQFKVYNKLTNIWNLPSWPGWVSRKALMRFFRLLPALTRNVYRYIFSQEMLPFYFQVKWKVEVIIEMQNERTCSMCYYSIIFIAPIVRLRSQ